MGKKERAGRMLLAMTAMLLFLVLCRRFSAHVVLSGSMEPVLKTGGIVFTDCSRVTPEIGDIITYQKEELLVTHRVKGRQGDAYVTKGDANEYEDTALVTSGQILGTVVFFLPYLGYCAAFFRQKTVFCLIVLMLAEELIFMGIQWKGERIRIRGKKMNKTKKNIKKAVFLTGVLCLTALGGVSAYLTDYDKALNQFTVGKVDIELEEPNWKPEDHTKIESGKDIDKDPQIKNTGVNDAFVYLEINVPMADVIAADPEGNRLDQKVQELFSFSAKAGWTRLETKKKENQMIYVYAYDKVLKPEETTGSLFDTVKFLNIIEGQLDTQQLDMPVRAYAIQTSYTGGDKGSIPDQARSAYEKYVNQNRDQEGQVTL